MAAEDWAVVVPQTPEMAAAETAGDGRRFVQGWLAAIGVEEEARSELVEALVRQGITSKVMITALGAESVSAIMKDYGVPKPVATVMRMQAGNKRGV